MDGSKNPTVTIGARGLVAVALAVLALVTAYLLGDAGGATVPASAAGQPPAAAVDPDEPRTLTLVGTGEATAVPDQLGFALEVAATRPDLETALDDTSRITDRVLRSLARYGVRRRDVQTTGLSMYPVYDYHENAPRTLRGYRVSQRAQVLVDDLAQGGRAISAAVAAGGNTVRVDDIRLRVGDPEAVLRRARNAAVAQATAKAEQYAAAAGQELGAVRTLREVRSSRPAPAWDRRLEVQAVRGALDSRALPIRAGRDDLSVTVQVVWEFA